MTKLRDSAKPTSSIRTPQRGTVVGVRSGVRSGIASAAVALALVAATSTPAFAGFPALDPNRLGMYVIGDSWAAGLYADPDHTFAQDAAAELDLDVLVDAESGSGYVTAPGGTRTYVDRAADIPAGTTAQIVLIQGGSNDVGAGSAEFEQAVRQTIDEVRTRLPDAVVVLLGPGPDPWPVTDAQTAIDVELQHVARGEHAHYISPLQRGWFTLQSIGSIIDPITNHPTIAGDHVLGSDLALALSRLVGHLEVMNSGS